MFTVDMFPFSLFEIELITKRIRVACSNAGIQRVNYSRHEQI